MSWGLVVADEAQHVKNARSATAQALRTIPAAARVALTGTPVENNLTELWAILDWTTPGLLGQPAGVPQGLGRADRVGPRADQGASVRRPDRPVPAAPPQDRPGHRARAARPRPRPTTCSGSPASRSSSTSRSCATRWQRIERADEDTRRGLVLKLLTGLKQICNHPAHFLKQSGGRLAGRSEKLDLLDELLGTALAEEQLGPGLHPVRRDGPAARGPPDPRRSAPPVPARRHARAPARGDGRGASRPARGRAGLPAVAQGRRHRPQPHPRRPRRPRRPLVEPRRRGPGHRPRPPHRADPRRCRSTGWSPRAPSRSGSPSCCAASGPWPTPCSPAARRALTELSNDELLDLVSLRRTP